MKSCSDVGFNLRTALAQPIELPYDKINADDIAHEGMILCQIKHKGIFFKKRSSLNFHHLLLLVDGVLLIRDHSTKHKGYAVILNEATRLTTTSKHIETKTGTEHHCIIQLKYTFGSVKILLRNTEVQHWLDYLQEMHRSGFYRKSTCSTLSASVITTPLLHISSTTTCSPPSSKSFSKTSENSISTSLEVDETASSGDTENSTSFHTVKSFGYSNVFPAIVFEYPETIVMEKDAVVEPRITVEEFALKCEAEMEEKRRLNEEHVEKKFLPPIQMNKVAEIRYKMEKNIRCSQSTPTTSGGHPKVLNKPPVRGVHIPSQQLQRHSAYVGSSASASACTSLFSSSRITTTPYRDYSIHEIPLKTTSNYRIREVLSKTTPAEHPAATVTENCAPIQTTDHLKKSANRHVRRNFSDSLIERFHKLTLSEYKKVSASDSEEFDDLEDCNRISMDISKENTPTTTGTVIADKTESTNQHKKCASPPDSPPYWSKRF